jgi:hypothetical protein
VRTLTPKRLRGSKRSLNVASLAAFAYSGAVSVPARNKRRATRKSISYDTAAQYESLDEKLE